MATQKTSKKAGIVLASSIISSASQALILILLARLLGKEDFGEIAKLIMIFRTAIILGSFGFNNNPFYFIPKLKESQRGSFFLQCLQILLISGLAFGIISTGFFYYFFESYFIAGVFIPTICLELMSEVTRNFFISIGKAKSAAFYSIFSSLLNTAIILIACLYSEDILVNLTLGFFIYSILRFLMTYFMNFKTITEQKETLPPNLLKEQFIFGVPLGFSQLAFKLNMQIDNYVVAFFFPNKIFAEYSVGSWEIPVALKIPNSITSVYLTKYTQLFDEGKFEELNKKFCQVTEKITLLLIPITSFFLIFGREIFLLIFGANFEQAGIVFQIYTITLFTRVVNYSSFLKSFGESKFIFKISIILLVLNLLLNLILIKIFGLFGAPIGTLLANLIVLGFTLIKISQILNLRITQILPYSFYFKTVFLSLFLAIGIRFSALQILENNLIAILSSIPVYLIGFFTLGSIFKLIGSEDKVFILSLIKGKKK